MSSTTGTGAKKILGTDNWRDIFSIHNDTVDAYDGIIGTTSMGTQATTIKGAVKELNDQIVSLKYQQTLQDYTGTSQQTIQLSRVASDFLLMQVALYDSSGNVVDAITMNPLYFRNVTVKLYGESSSMWGTVLLSNDFASVTCNRTSANTQKIRINGLILVN